MCLQEWFTAVPSYVLTHNINKTLTTLSLLKRLLVDNEFLIWLWLRLDKLWHRHTTNSALTLDQTAALEQQWSSTETGWLRAANLKEEWIVKDKGDRVRKKPEGGEKAETERLRDIQELCGGDGSVRVDSERKLTGRQQKTEEVYLLLLSQHHLSPANSLPVLRGCMTEINQRAIVHTLLSRHRPIDTGMRNRQTQEQKREGKPPPRLSTHPLATVLSVCMTCKLSSQRTQLFLFPHNIMGIWLNSLSQSILVFVLLLSSLWLFVKPQWFISNEDGEKNERCTQSLGNFGLPQLWSG